MTKTYIQNKLTSGDGIDITGTTISVVNPISTVTSVTIAVADWSSGTTATKSVTGVTATNTVIASPSAATMSTTIESKVYVSAQGAGTLTFTADTTPTAEITFNVVVI